MVTPLKQALASTGKPPAAALPDAKHWSDKLLVRTAVNVRRYPDSTVKTTGALGSPLRLRDATKQRYCDPAIKHGDHVIGAQVLAFGVTARGAVPWSCAVDRSTTRRVKPRTQGKVTHGVRVAKLTMKRLRQWQGCCWGLSVEETQRGAVDGDPPFPTTQQPAPNSALTVVAGATVSGSTLCAPTPDYTGKSSVATVSACSGDGGGGGGGRGGVGWKKR